MNKTLKTELNAPSSPPAIALANAKGGKFTIRDLSVLAYANGFTLWHYKTGKLSAVLTDKFFIPAADMMTIGDMILISGEGGAKIVVVASVTDKSVVLGGIS
jgi:hypothetical protein